MTGQHQPITFILENSLSELNRLSEMLDKIGEQWQLPGKALLQLNLVLDELFTNVVSYGFEKESTHQVRFTIQFHADEVQITMCDDGKPFDPTLPANPDFKLPIEDKEIGGLGIFLIRQYTDEVDYKREHEQNIVTLTKKI